MNPSTSGITLSEMMSDAIRLTVIASENGTKNSPARPPTNASGRNTATVVIVPEMSGPAMSRKPRATPSHLASPASHRW